MHGLTMRTRSIQKATKESHHLTHQKDVPRSSSLSPDQIAMESILSGLFGSLGSIAGKLALSSDSPISTVCVNELGKTLLDIPQGYCTMITITFRALLFFAMLGCNGLMLSYFLMALEKRGTLIVVIISSTCNVLTSGLLGLVVFHETVKSSWYFGACLMLGGVCLVAFSQMETTKKIPG